MKMIVTLTMNPSVDKNSSVGNVVAEKKLYAEIKVLLKSF